MILAGVSSFQVCKLRCKILISGSALSGGRLPRSLRNVSLLDIFLFLLSSLQVFCSLFTFRAATMRDFGTAPFRAAALSVWGRARTFLSAWFESTVSHHKAHGLDNPQGRTCNLPCREKALESLPRCSFPDRMCANQQPRRRTGAVFIWPPERNLERGAWV